MNAAATHKGELVKTKKNLKQLLSTVPEEVRISSTDLFHSFSGPATDLPEGQLVSVVGPDPYNKRMWYATVKRLGDKVVCS
jgi:hypothetical protein